jgi:hypothetical protein
VSFASVTLCVVSQRVFIVVYLVIDSVRKLLDTPSYLDDPYHAPADEIEAKCASDVFSGLSLVLSVCLSVFPSHDLTVFYTNHLTD